MYRFEIKTVSYRVNYGTFPVVMAKFRHFSVNKCNRGWKDNSEQTPFLFYWQKLLLYLTWVLCQQWFHIGLEQRTPCPLIYSLCLTIYKLIFKTKMYFSYILRQPLFGVFKCIWYLPKKVYMIKKKSLMCNTNKYAKLLIIYNVCTNKYI